MSGVEEVKRNNQIAESKRSAKREAQEESSQAREQEIQASKSQPEGKGQKIDIQA